MKAFFSKYSYLIIWIVAIVAIGGAFVFVVQENLHLSPRSSPAAGGAATAAPVPVSPSVSLTLVKSKAGNSLFVQWANLPSDTTALKIFRGMKNSTSGWSLWKTLTLSADQLAGGNDSISLGNNSFSGYSYYVEAVNGNGNGANGSNGAGFNPAVLWTSAVTDPTVTTSTPETGPQNNPGSNPPPGTPTPSSTPSSTPPASPPASSSTTHTPPGNPSPSGTPYYNPQVQVQGYVSGQTNNFWVQYTNRNIEIGWQNLPPGTDSVVILRSVSEDGPWTAVYTQQNPTINSAYSIQLVDETLGQPNYYEMNAVSGGVTIAAYGPVYLPAQTQ